MSLSEQQTAPTAAEQARTLMACGSVATLATVGSDGAPWASYLAYALLADGSPVLCVSTMAEHGRNLVDDQRASLCVLDQSEAADPLETARVTLAGVARRPADDEEDAAARAAFLAAHPGTDFMDFHGFSIWVVDVERARWVGGFARMDSADGAAYGAAAPDPVAPHSAGAVSHLNEDHADALLAMARAFGGHPDAVSAVCLRTDRYGLDLEIQLPDRREWARVPYATVLDEPAQLRAATVDLTKRARALLG
jgi:heme iron utilization protein